MRRLIYVPLLATLAILVAFVATGWARPRLRVQVGQRCREPAAEYTSGVSGHSASEKSDAERARGAPDAVFEWKAHPARERPLVALVVLVIIAVLPGWMVGLERNFGWALFAAVVLLFALQPFFFVSYYAISDAGVSGRTLAGRRFVAWGEVQRVAVGRYAAWVSAARGPGWRERRRGVLLLFGKQRAEVLARLRARVPAAEWEDSTNGA